MCSKANVKQILCQNEQCIPDTEGKPSGLPNERILLMWLCPRTTKPVGVCVPHLVIKNKSESSLLPLFYLQAWWLISHGFAMI